MSTQHNLSLPPVISEVRISCIKRLNGQLNMWVARIVVRQGFDCIGQHTFKSEYGQSVIDWVREWHLYNEVPALECLVVPAVEYTGHFGLQTDYYPSKGIKVVDMYCDDEFVIARLSLNHD